MSFKSLNIGAVFRFASECNNPGWGLARGPWRKISARRYVHAETGLVCSVGSIHVLTIGVW